MASNFYCDIPQVNKATISISHKLDNIRNETEALEKKHGNYLRNISDQVSQDVDACLKKIKADVQKMQEDITRRNTVLNRGNQQLKEIEDNDRIQI